jgi:uncharacterized membrane protein YkvA (DUF1232 family)
MPLEVKFTLSDEDLKRFQDIVDAARSNMDDEHSMEQIEAAARQLIQEAQKGELPEFVAIRMQKLDLVINMVNDDEWQLSEDERHHVMSALAYLCDPEDLIPDHVPGLGFLDDAIYAEIVLDALQSEISLYQEFCDFRVAEEARREKRGDGIKVGREEWLADKRAALHAKMRKRRMGTGSKAGWRIRLW